MGISNYTPATRQTIRAYLQSVGKAKLSDITDLTQADNLRQQIQPKCHKGHVINKATLGGPWKCDSQRSGAACLKQISVSIYCDGQGCGGSNSSTCYDFCLPCGFHGS
jgi:hypothetical protein